MSTPSWWKRPVVSPAAEKFNNLVFISVLLYIVLPNALIALIAGFLLWRMQ